MNINNKITVYTDGSALNNGSSDSGCGWACKLIYRGHDKDRNNIEFDKTAVMEARKNKCMSS